MRRVRHLLRDLLLLTLPIMGVGLWIWIAALGSFWNAEIRNFHGELVRDLRVGTLRTMLQASTRQLFHPKARRYLPIRRAPSANPPQVVPDLPVFDLRIDGVALDALAEDLPASARERQKAVLDVGPRTLEVNATWRGQKMENYFFQRKAWKLRTKKGDFVEGLRVLNLTPLEDRLASLVTFTAARAAGLPTPQTRLVHLFVNLEDQGVYLLEEQIDESMIRRIGAMPGDVFYGELFVPEVPASSCWELFWNPYLWEKNDRFNRYSEEWRPWLKDLLDATCDPSPAGLDRLQELLDPSFARHVALLAFQGDQHLDHSHNWKLHFDPLSGRFLAIAWNPLLNMPEGQGLESTANRLLRRLAQDPRFLDEVQRIVHDEMLEGGLARAQIEELDRVEAALRAAGVFEDGWLPYAMRGTRSRIEARAATVRRHHEVAKVAFTQREEEGEALSLSVFATCAASLRLEGVVLRGRAFGVRLFEDRDFDGRLSDGDRQLSTRAEGSRLVVFDPGALLYPGRDFTASYHRRPSEGQDTFHQHREFTRLAGLESRYLLVPEERIARESGEDEEESEETSGARASDVPAVRGLELSRTVGNGAVVVSEGEALDFVASGTVHPWRIPPPPAPRRVELAGEVELRDSLRLSERDELQVAPGTKLKLGPGVSIQARSRVEWKDVQVTRLDPARPFGVIALQGHGCDGSVLERCTIEGGSEATLGHLYYSGMFSAHRVDRLVVRDCLFAGNVLGDDGVRLGACRDVLFERVRVEHAIADAIDFDLCQGTVRDVVVVRPGNDGFDMMTGRLTLERFETIGAGDKGVSVGEGSRAELSACAFLECVTGIGIKDGSDPIVRDTRVEGCGVGVEGCRKNWRYAAGGGGRLVGCTLRGNGVDVRLDGSSRLALENCATEGKFELSDEAAADALVEIPPRAAAGTVRQ
jgi:hypothetical protein